MAHCSLNIPNEACGHVLLIHIGIEAVGDHSRKTLHRKLINRCLTLRISN